MDAYIMFDWKCLQSTQGPKNANVCVMHMFLLHRNDVIMRVYSWPKAKSLNFLQAIPGKILVYLVITIHWILYSWVISKAQPPRMLLIWDFQEQICVGQGTKSQWHKKPLGDHMSILSQNGCSWGQSSARGDESEGIKSRESCLTRGPGSEEN